MIKVGDCREYNDERERELPQLLQVSLKNSSVTSCHLLFKKRRSRSAALGDRALRWVAYGAVFTGLPLFANFTAYYANVKEKPPPSKSQTNPILFLDEVVRTV